MIETVFSNLANNQKLNKKREAMKKMNKANWEKPEVSKLSVKNLTLSGTNPGKESEDTAKSSKS